VIEILAELTGTVWKVMAVAGQEVKAGETLVILESMKMEIPVEAPRAGVVDDVRVQEGDQVVNGAVLAVIRS
jgi:acetyl-CoA carboxylase biotin carboxyl carrier protein